ncbi:MAG: hypothetical protein ACFFBQ_11060 [Promethearchaeota archaeon]
MNSRIFMEPSRKKLETLANQLNLTPAELEMVSRSKKKYKFQYGIVAIFESILGVLSFLYGYHLAPTHYRVVNGYPFLTPYIIIGIIPNNPLIKKKKSIFLIGFISMIILLIGIFSGYTAGMAMKTTNVSPRYGVYTNETAHSH